MFITVAAIMAGAITVVAIIAVAMLTPMGAGAITLIPMGAMPTPIVILMPILPLSLTWASASVGN
jgi:hypothetical protein